MNDLILYLFKSGISLILLYAVYSLFLSRDTFFKMNRVYLIVSVLFSLLFPLLPISLPFTNTDQTYIVMLDTIVINASKINPAVSSNLETFQIIGIIYLTGMAIFFVRFMFQIGQLILMVRRNGISRQQGLNIVLIDRNYAPFSFFGLIFINRKELNEKQVQEIIDHELVHVNQRHSLDLILMEIMTIIQWFNPFVWFYRHSIKTVHEYLADEGVLLKGHNPIDYQKLLLAQSTGIQVNDLTNNFNHSLIKKRILMMTKSKSTVIARLKLLTAMPVAFMLVLAFTASPLVETIAQVEQQKQEKKQIKQSSNETAEKQIFTVVDQMPEFPGGPEGRIKYLVENVKYPESARKQGIEGTVFVTFVVEKDGSVSNAEVLRGIGGGCDEEALRVVREMPNWKPGMQRGKPVRVQFNVPLKFNLGNEREVKDGNDKTAPPPPPKREKK